MNHSDLYKDKSIEYFSNTRKEIIELINRYNCNILELGCGTGNTLIELKKCGKAKYIVGIDVLDVGQSEKLDKFFPVDIENEEIYFPDNFFDIIICADVLEHLKNPWFVLKKLKKYLKTDGFIIASLPNIREFKTLYNIVIRGDFKYENAGVLDKTHLRFFCKKNIISLFSLTGYEIISISPYFSASLKRKLLNKFFMGIFEEFLAEQYIVIANTKYL